MPDYSYLSSQTMSDSGCLESLVMVLLTPSTKDPVMVEVTAAIAVLADIGKGCSYSNYSIDPLCHYPEFVMLLCYGHYAV